MISPHFRYSPDFILPKSQARLSRAGIVAIKRKFSKLVLCSEFKLQLVSIFSEHKLKLGL